MAAISQPDWRSIARQEFAGYQIAGTGPFAVVDYYSGIVQLFEHLLLANATGKRVRQLQPPTPRPSPRRRIYIRD
jgi:hypothetical protein